MQKKTPPLKLIVPLLALLVMIGNACVGMLASVLASSLNNFGTGPDSTSCVGNNNSGMPNSDCSTNTPFPSPGSCQLAWTDGGGGTVALDVSRVGNDQGLQSTLAGYNLRCAAGITVTSCALVNDNSGNTKLDLANMVNRSPWIYQQLNSGQYTLMCNGATNSVLETIQTDSNYSFQVTTPCCITRFLSYHNNDLLGYTDVIDSGSSTPLKQDATFKIVPGLAGTGCYSFESLNDPTSYLRHSSYRIHMDKEPNNGSVELFKKDATFCEQPGLSGTGVSFRSFNFPGRYIRHINGQLWISSNGGPNPWDNQNSYTDDVTWKVVPALVS